jgi:hypothetical protein
LQFIRLERDDKIPWNQEFNMSKKDTFNATKQAMNLYAGLFKDVAQEVGVEKALELHAKQGTATGAGVVEILKAELGRKKLNLAALESMTKKVAGSFGTTPKFEKKKGVLKATHGRCPVYEACLSAGIAPQVIERMCQQFSALEYDEIKKAFPQFSGCVKVRSMADEPCIEEFAILK